ncbi:hypothetical protein GPECTOR_3g516 [Gonium pectorale]|uniref:EF-hand domain-containing protein n=1 Tax=Gonium pectorale TaxID=33097 RepID=A0A150H1F2_GONPE|nr:hypothetical protein GPECTOR_3g516 [Gonium pectorale]|eukprot:KXZ55390.1 hypothetical protein GPECTOR_3g516 [Gonium pectorale]
MLKKQDEAYLAKHKLDALFGEILQGLSQEMPRDPVQYIIDSVRYGVDQAKQMYANRYGGQTLGSEELTSIFADFKPGQDNLVTEEEFLVFFSRVSKTITNAQFEAMVKEMIN